VQGGGEKGDKGEHTLSIMEILERRARAPTVNAILKDENAIKVKKLKTRHLNNKIKKETH